jgi:phosphoribosyl-ATP pyrophosphohydrolase/phosphoribosyl-AMP cyclohydrolase
VRVHGDRRVRPGPYLAVTRKNRSNGGGSLSRATLIFGAPARPSIITRVEIEFDKDGLAPCVVQDWGTGEVLTLAYVNDEALARTRETGEMHFWSRSRNELWRKGETSGNVQRVKALRYDCDADALLALVEPAGPACHTGERTCFYRGEMEPAPHEALPALERTIAERASSKPGGSYTAELLADPPRIGAKVREEADEVAAAASEESDERVTEEAADVLYHLSVLLASRGLALEEALEVLNARRR